METAHQDDRARIYHRDETDLCAISLKRASAQLSQPIPGMVYQCIRKERIWDVPTAPRGFVAGLSTAPPIHVMPKITEEQVAARIGPKVSLGYGNFEMMRRVRCTGQTELCLKSLEQESNSSCESGEQRKN